MNKKKKMHKIKGSTGSCLEPQVSHGFKVFYEENAYKSAFGVNKDATHKQATSVSR